MAAVLTVTPAAESLIGVPLIISGTGFAATTTVTIKITSQEESAEETWEVDSDGSGDWVLPGSFTPQEAGLYTITATDGVSTKVVMQKVDV